MNRSFHSFCAWWLFWTCLVIAVPSLKAEVAYRTCPNNHDPIFKARLDPSTGSVVLLGTATADSMEVDDNILYLRKCAWCGPYHVYYGNITADFYCSVDFKECGIPFSSHAKGKCWQQSGGESFLVNNAWPAVWLFYGALVIILFTFTSGRYAQDFCYSFCFPNRNRRLVDQMVERNGRRANYLIRRFQHREQRRHERLGDGHARDYTFALLFHRVPERHFHAETVLTDARPQALALKTKKYAPTQDEMLEEEDGLTCTICFGVIEDGTKVGDLSCGHLFHVDCLKTWLKRRNVCPLCQKTNVAAERFRHEHNLSAPGVAAETEHEYNDPEVAAERTEQQERDGPEVTAETYEQERNFSSPGVAPEV
jgi:hypothetical protein